MSRARRVGLGASPLRPTDVTQFSGALSYDWVYPENRVATKLRGWPDTVDSSAQRGLLTSGVVVRGCVMTAKPLLVMLLATLLGPVIGVGLFILMQTL